MAAKFFTGLPLDGPDPECVKGYGELQLAACHGRQHAASVTRPLAGRTDLDRQSARPRLRHQPGRVTTRA